jgi:hypothetical protein
VHDDSEWFRFPSKGSQLRIKQSALEEDVDLNHSEGDRPTDSLQGTVQQVCNNVAGS